MTQQLQMTGRAWAELGLLSLIWGAVFLCTTVALREIGPLTVVAHRVTWACLILWAVVAFLRLPVPRTRRALLAFAVMGVLNNALPFTLQAWGQLHIESGLTAILNAGTAIWGLLIAAIFLADERLTPSKVTGVTLGFLGVATAIGLDAFLAFDPTSLGQLAVIGSTISYGFAGVWARKRMSGLHPIVQAAGMLTSASLIMVPLAWTIEGPIHFELSQTTWAALLFLTVVATAGAYLLFYRVLAIAGSANLFLCTLLIAPVAILLGAAFLSEALPPRAFAGFGILALGLLVISGRLPLPRLRAQS